MADVSQIKLPNGSVYDLIDEKSGYITAEYIENKTDYEIPVSRVGEIVVGETAIGTDSTNFPTSKAVVDYVDERVVQEMDAIDVGVTGIKANGTSLSVVDGVVNIPAIGPNQSVGLITEGILYDIYNNIPTSTSQLTNDSGYVVGPSSSVNNHVATFNGTNGNTIQDSGYTIAKSVPSSAVFTDQQVKSTVTTSTTTHNYPILLHSSTSSTETTAATKSSVFYFHVDSSSEYFLKVQNASLASSYLSLTKNYNSALYSTKIQVNPTPTNSSITLTLPKETGTLALTSDIPTVPTNISSFTNDSGYLTASDIASVMTYKGTKANYAALPSTGNTTGDVWHLTDTGAEWAWDGSAWQELGTAIDVSSFLTSESDPVFTASPAHGIAASDSTNWNGKTAVSIVRW